MTVSVGRRKAWSVGLGAAGLVLLATFVAMNAWDPKALKPETTGQIFLYTALSAVVFVLFVSVLVMLVRNVLKLYAEQKSRVMGSRLRTRMLWGAVLVSMVPLAFMFLFSYSLLNRSVDRWFSQPVTTLREDADRMALELSQYTAANARVEAESIAQGLPGSDGNGAAMAKVLREHELTLQGGFAVVYRDGHAVAGFHLPDGSGGAAVVKPWLGEPATAGSASDGAELATNETLAADAAADDAILSAAQRTDEPVYASGRTEYSLGLATELRRTGAPVKVVVGLPLPYGMSSTMSGLRSAADEYFVMLRARRTVRSSYMLLLLMMTSLALFCSTWLALHLSKQVTKPVEALADAMASIAAGDYAQRVGESATEELGELVLSFNHMAEDLEVSRAKVEASATLLGAANAALEARRSELETMLETIPNGVATLDRERRIVLANRALSEMMDPGGEREFLGVGIGALFPAEVMEVLERLMARSHRMGSASAELEMSQNGHGALNLLATVALLEAGAEREHVGYVVVLENATELLRAQRQSAWKEVARRVAHEIKNPLTPISLNAEQIGRHIDRLEDEMSAAGVESASVAVIRRGTQVISASVESMRGLVDQFAALAEFPTARPRPADLNTIVENSLAMFAGRTQGVRMVRRLEDGLPLVLADPEAMKRALGNLMDNALEAMSGSLLREMRISTSLLESGMVELTLSDTGTGLTDEMRERLFLPYFSTKQRGTGLGLAIAAKIIQEHGGTIRAEKHEPVGAKFIVELKAASEAEEKVDVPAAAAVVAL